MPSLPPISGDFATVVILVLDGLGIGGCAAVQENRERPAPDTLAHVAGARPMAIPNLTAMGLGDLRCPACGPDPATGLCSSDRAARTGSSVRLIPSSPGKDSLTGHWELAGLITDLELQTFPGGFPPEFMDSLRACFGRGLLGGGPASGTEIIERLGPQHLRTGELIVYTSADSVLQVAAHEDVIAKTELYRLCRNARKMAVGPWLVGRVIARPFSGVPGGFVRTGRRDFSLTPPGPTVLEAAQAAGVEVVTVGKVADIFAGRGITTTIAAAGNQATMQALMDLGPYRLGDDGPRRLVFANLNDFDSIYGHRRDAAGFAAALEEFDRFLPRIMPPEGGRAILAVTADHGCDPTYPGTDHTREDVPLLVTGPAWRHAHLGTVKGLTAVAGLAAAALGLEGFCYWPRRTSAGGITQRGE